MIQEEEEKGPPQISTPSTQLTQIQPSQGQQGQNDLDQLTFELANKITRGQMKLKETKLDQMESEVTKAIKSNMLDWEND